MFKYTKSAIHYIYRDIRRIYKVCLYIIFFLTLAYYLYAIYRDRSELIYLILNGVTAFLFVLSFILLQACFRKDEQDTRVEKIKKKKKKRVLKVILKILMYLTHISTITLGIIEITKTNLSGFSLAATIGSIIIISVKILLDAIFYLFNHYIDLLRTGFDEDTTFVSVFDRVKRANVKAEQICGDDTYLLEQQKKLDILDKELEYLQEEQERKHLARLKIIEKCKTIEKARKLELASQRRLFRRKRKK